jgi:hypothetical protein
MFITRCALSYGRKPVSPQVRETPQPPVLAGTREHTLTRAAARAAQMPTQTLQLSPIQAHQPLRLTLWGLF